MSPFDFLNSINSASKKSLFDGCNALEEELNPDSPSKSYVTFVINRSLSYFQDTILLANEMNVNHNLAPKMQYDFLKGSVKPRKRFAKWAKSLPDEQVIDLLVKTYGYSRTRAREAVSVMSHDDLKQFTETVNRGKNSYK